MIYLDNNATTRVLPEVLEAMLPHFSEIYFNPTSATGNVYGAGKPLEDACEALGALLGSKPEEIYLTSGATESNNWVLRSVVTKALDESGQCHIVVSAIEHPSVLEVVSFLGERHPGLAVDLAPVTTDGVVDPDRFRELVREDTALVSVMLANNETGVLQPIHELAGIAKAISPTCLFHTDATQAIGKVPVSLRDDLQDVDFLSLSAHKFHGPKGIGALYLRSGIELDPLFHGGGQQRGLRSGTDNPALAAGLAQAAIMAQPLDNSVIVSANRDALEAGLGDLGLEILGARTNRLPNTTLVLFPDTDSDLVVHELLAAGFATSSGSACSAGSDTPSHVVLAMGVEYNRAFGSVRFSLSRETSEDDIAKLLEALTSISKQIPNPVITR